MSRPWAPVGETAGASAGHRSGRQVRKFAVPTRARARARGVAPGRAWPRLRRPRRPRSRTTAQAGQGSWVATGALAWQGLARIGMDLLNVSAAPATTERLHAIRRPAGPARCVVAAANLGACEPDALRTWTVAKMVSRGLAPVAARPRATPRKRKTRRSCRRAPDTASSLSVLDSQHSRTCQIRHRQWSRWAENVARNHGPPADGLRFRRPGRCAGTRKVQGWRASAAGNKSIRWMI